MFQQGVDRFREAAAILNCATSGMGENIYLLAKQFKGAHAVAQLSLFLVYSCSCFSFQG